MSKNNIVCTALLSVCIIALTQHLKIQQITPFNKMYTININTRSNE